MLQQKRNHVAVFGHAVDGTMERRTRIYPKLTMPNKSNSLGIASAGLMKANIVSDDFGRDFIDSGPHSSDKKSQMPREIFCPTFLVNERSRPAWEK